LTKHFLEYFIDSDLPPILVPHVKLEFSHFSILNSGTSLSHFAPAEFKR